MRLWSWQYDQSTAPDFGARMRPRPRRVGFYTRRQRGSHIILRRDAPYAQVVVPDHRELDTGTLRAIIKDAGLSVAEFTQLL